MTRLYTRTGDEGMTGLGNNQRVHKDDLRVEICGNLDELSSFIGLVRTCILPLEISELLQNIQQNLLILGSEFSLAIPATLTMEEVIHLETLIDQYNGQLAPVKNFILPGGTQAAALTHVARTVCRRTERSVVTLVYNDNINTNSLIYLNRLSDLLFVLARLLNN